MENNFDDLPVQPRRPQFLTIICILTFIGSGYGLINAAITYFNAENIQQAMIQSKEEVFRDMSKDKKTDKPKENFVKSIMADVSDMVTPDNLRKVSIGNAIASLICLFGAILMWKLKRTGFYLYIAGTLVGIATPYYFLGRNFITNLQVGVLVFIGILFIIFYAMNLKSMK